MIAAALVLLQAAATALPPPPPPPQDWAGLPVFPIARSTTISEGTAFIRGEVEAGRCRGDAQPVDGIRLSMPMAILVAANQQVRRIVPRAIGCPTVEQFTAGYLLSLTRDGVPLTTPLAPGWYRLTIGYRW